MNRAKLIIPPKRLMTQTNAGDPVFFHYYPITSIVYRRRLKNTLRLIEDNRFENLLEIGYGSGIFLPTLSKIAQSVSALDIHTERDAVRGLLDNYEISNVTLVSDDIMKMPFEDDEFDACVIVSTLEDIQDSERAVSEIKRVVKRRGHLYISLPVKNLITDTFFRLVGEDPEEIHPSDHRYIFSFLKDNFDIVRVLKYPRFLPMDLALYVSIHCVNRK